MPDSLGNITVPDLTPSGTWPLIVRNGTVRQLAPKVVIHTFGSANEKVEQRYYVGKGERRFQLQYPKLTKSDLDTAVAFWRDRYGAVTPFTLNYPLEEGGTSTPTVRLADDVLTVQRDSQKGGSLNVTLVEIPTSFPTYTVTKTLSRFPDGAFAAALLAQVQEIIPLLRIRPKLIAGETFPDNIFLSDRRCTVGGQLYQARLLEWGGISQATSGENDTAKFVLGNADGVLESLAADVDLSDAAISFSLYHVGSQTRLDLWTGEVSEFDPDENGQKFTVSATDIAGALNEFCPQRVVDRSCWKNFNDGTNCPYATVNPAGVATSCDKSWDTGCSPKGMTSYFGGVIVKPQGVVANAQKGAFYTPRVDFTSTSIINDSIYGKAIPHIYTDAPLPVPVLIAAGREEGDFYAVVGIVGEGPLSAYNSDGLQHRLDGQPPHGPLPKGLRRSFGHDPVQDNDPDANSQFFSLGAGTGTQTYDVYRAAGVAFLDIRRTDAKGLQLSRVQDHVATASVSGGMGGWVWTDDVTRVFANTLVNPIWIAVNEYLRTKGLFSSSQAAQEASVDVHSAVGAAAICSTIVSPMFGAGTETQFQFRGIIAEQKPLKDQIQEILNNCLGYYYIANGKLKIGIRYNASAEQAFTAGNTLADSIRLRRTGQRTKFNQLSVQFADSDFIYQANTVTSQNEDHRKRYGKRQAQQMNLLGTFTKSQAARISETRLREALGGITAAEWKKQRTVIFRTTILALAIEPGMVCSLTHSRAPGGAINFRVKRIVWNSDWSADVEGDYVNASMYNMAAGPKPADVAVTPVPVESVNAVPGDVQAIGAVAFNCTVSDVADSNGVKRKRMAFTYNPPADISIFAGVSVWVETPGGIFYLGEADYNGDGSAITPGRYGTGVVFASPPSATETWRLYLVSRSRSYQNRLAVSAETIPSPYVTLTVAPVSALVVPPAAPAENVSTIAATVTYNADRWGLDIVVGFGSNRASIAKAEIIVRGPTNAGTSVDRVAWEFIPPATGSLSGSIGGEWLRAGSSRNFVVLVKVYNSDDVPAASPTSSTTVSVAPVNYTTQATSASVSVWKDYNADGVEVYGFTLGWTQANDIDTSHTEVWISAYDGVTSAYRKEQLYTMTAEDGSDNGFALSGRGALIDAVPASSQSFRVFFYTYTVTGFRKKPAAPYVDVTVSPGTGALKLNRAASSSIGDGVEVSGGILRVADSGISSAKIQAAAVTNTKLQDLAVDANKLASSSVTSTKIANAAVGSAAIANLAVGNAAIADGAITNAKITDATIQSAKIANLNADKINAGTITVGAGGMSFSGTGGIAVSGNGSIAVSTGGVSANNIYALASGYGWSMIGGTVPSLDYTALFSGGYVNAPSLRVGGTTVVDSSRNAVFADLKYTGIFQINSGSTSSVGTPSSFTKFFYVYDSAGSLLGYVPIF